MGQSSQGHVQRRPNAPESRRELHRLIQDTAMLVEVLTEQAIELEGQGWNRAIGKIGGLAKRGEETRSRGNMAERTIHIRDG